MPIGAIVPQQVDLLTVSIDPTWPYLEAWTKDVGLGLNRVAARFMDLEDGISETAATSYAEAEVYGRAETIRVFTGVGAREVPLVFKFHVQGDLNIQAPTVPQTSGASLSILSANNRAIADHNQQVAANNAAVRSPANNIIQEVYIPAKMLDAFRYPYTDSSGIQHAPPPLILRIGSHLSMRCVITDIKHDWQSPVDPDTHLFFGCHVAIVFTATTAQMSNYKVSPVALRIGPDPDPNNGTSNLTAIPSSVTISPASPRG